MSKDHIQRCINSFATQSFRDQADRDYISARLACRYELYPQFLWASHQAIEKYLKAILLYNRIEAKNVRHNLAAALNLTQKLSFNIELSSRSKDFIKHISEYGEYRYLDIPYYVLGYLMVDLDLTVWELRRYCQVLYPIVSDITLDEEEALKVAWINIEKSKSESRYKYRMANGLLEKILDDPKHFSRLPFLWQNSMYGVRHRAVVKIKKHMHFQNPILYLNPDALNELRKLVFIPHKLATEYQELAKKINSDHH